MSDLSVAAVLFPPISVAVLRVVRMRGRKIHVLFVLPVISCDVGFKSIYD